jgi:hypothetical protein
MFGPAEMTLDFLDGTSWNSKVARMGEMRLEYDVTTVELELYDLTVTKTKEETNDCAEKAYCSQDCKFFEDCFPEAVREPEPEPERGGDDSDDDPDESGDEYHDCSIHCWI